MVGWVQLESIQVRPSIYTLALPVIAQYYGEEAANLRHYDTHLYDMLPYCIVCFTL